MNTIQIFAGAALVAVPAVIMAVFWKVGTAGGTEDYKDVTSRGYVIRRKYFWGLLAASLAFLAIGVYTLPYPQLAAAKAINEKPPHVVKATAKQFAFELSSDRLPLGPVRFDVTSEDVNHGFAIYDENGNLVSQTQAMPYYVNRLYVDFKKPGKYEIWCLEYCGVAHHVMTAGFEVK